MKIAPTLVCALFLALLTALGCGGGSDVEIPDNPDPMPASGPAVPEGEDMAPPPPAEEI